MEWHLVDEDEEPEDHTIAGIVSLIHIIIFYFVGCYIKRKCCPKREDERAAVRGQERIEGTAEQLQAKKSSTTCYMLWAMAGLVGTHHFYLGRIVHGVLACWTLNFFGLGWLLDGALMPIYVSHFNRKHTCAKAPYDRTSRALCIRLPMTIICVFGLVAGVAAYGPRGLQILGIVDVDALAAQTQANPYTTLDVDRGAPFPQIKSAYRKQSLKWHPDRNPGCGKECDDKMYEITKAFELIKKRGGDPSVGVPWSNWMQQLGSDWIAVISHFLKL